MKAVGWIFAVLVVVGLVSGGGESDIPDDTGYSDTYHGDVNGNPVPDDCAEWADSSDNPFGDDPYGKQLCEAWD